MVYNEAKGITALGSHVRNMVGGTANAPFRHIFPSLTHDKIMGVWPQFIAIIIGCKGPYSRGKSDEYVQGLVDDACKLFPTGLPVDGCLWVSNSKPFMRGDTNFTKCNVA